MAILNNLIVHGSSRFLNGINANSIHTNLIDADDGVFKTITTTTLDANTITTDMLKANNARVSQTLAVDGTISTNKWEAASIANIGGNFYISPTGKADSGTITVTKTGSTTVNGVTVGTYTIVVGDTAFGVTSTSSTIWGTNSKVIFTGSISYPKMTGTDLTTTGKKYPLGSCNGTMTQVSTGTGTLTGFTITGVNSPALDIFFKEVGVTSVSSTACSGYEMQISVYQSYYSNTLHPIGILLTSYGKEKKQYIDIYGGAYTLGDSDSGFAEPSVRIGQLDGLPDIRNGITASDSPTKPTGWGIYTSNGFFKGKIVSSAGLIGGWNITDSALYSGSSTTSTANGSVLLSTANVNREVSYNGSVKESGAIATVITQSDAAARFAIGNKFIVNTSGKVYAGNISVLGGEIGGFTIRNNAIYTGDYLNSIADNSIALTTTDFTRTINGVSREGLRFALGDKFGVTGDGILYANEANITGAVNATSFIAYDNANNTNRIRATVSADGLIIYDGNGVASSNIQAQFGDTATIGKTSGNNYNINITGTAIDLRYNASILNRINSDGMTLYDGDGVAESNQIASFGEAVTIGKQDVAQLKMDSGSIEGVGINNLSYFKIDNTGAIDTVVSYSYKKNYGPYSVTKTSSRSVSIKTTMDLLASGSLFSIGGYRTASGTWEGSKKKYTERLDFVKGTSKTTSFTSSSLDIFSIQYDGANTITITSTTTVTRYIYITTWERTESSTYTPAYLFGRQNISDVSYGKYAFVTGVDSIASGDISHVEGYETKTLSPYTHAEGSQTIAGSELYQYPYHAGESAHAEGDKTIARGQGSHSEGSETYAEGNFSHAEGIHTQALANMSHTQNIWTVADYPGQTVIGRYNKATVSGEGTEASPYQYTDIGEEAFIIGNGDGSLIDDDTSYRSNAFTVDWNGNVNAAGSYYGVTPWAHYSAGAPTLKSVSNRTYYWVTSFSGYVVNVRTNDTDVFDKVNAGLRVKRDGIYLVSLWIHFNGTSGDRLYARVARCVGGDISNIGGATISSYVTLDPTWAEISYEQVVVCLANDTLCPQVARESTSSGGSFRFGNMLMNVTYLGSNTKIVDL